MADRDDYYQLLDVARDATAAQIKKSFRELARKYHPDRNKEPDAEQRFKAIAEAYAVLSDPKKRAEYDAGALHGAQGFSAEDIFHGADLGDLFGGVGFGAGDNWFDRMFGRQRQQSPTSGEDVVARLTIPLERILSGGEETITLSHPETCKTCLGTGAKAGTSPTPCAACHGSGQQSTTSRRGPLQVRTVTTCQTCKGQGRVIDEPCPVCGGRGSVDRNRHLKVRIPAGVPEGSVLRLAGQGMPGPPGKPCGDLHLTVHSARHPLFERDGSDLWGHLPLDVADAALGTIVELPTLDGTASVRVPAGTQSDSVLRLAGKGLPRADTSARGDLFVRIQLRVPEQLSVEERRLFGQLRELRRTSRSPTVGAPN